MKQYSENELKDFNNRAITRARELVRFAAQTGEPEKRKDEIFVLERTALYILANSAANRVVLSGANLDEILAAYKDFIGSSADMNVKDIESGNVKKLHFNEETERGPLQ